MDEKHRDAQAALEQVARALLAEDVTATLWAARRARTAFPTVEAHALHEAAEVLHLRGRCRMSVGERGRLLELLARSHDAVRRSSLTPA